MSENIWLVGVGSMAIDYAKVLNGLQLDFSAVGRGKKSAEAFQYATGSSVILNGLENYLATIPKIPKYSIVAVGVESLFETTLQLIEYGIKNILVEKPAGLNKHEVEEIYIKAKEHKANVYVAYNRRCYASVLKSQEIISEDGGVTSFNFEFTEWAHEIEELKKPYAVKKNWFLSNSTHVVDLAFYLGGSPKKICTFTAGSLDWHPAAAIFSGAGVSEGGALFSYQANWESAGRWGLEILTKRHRLIFRPMEKLQIQKKGSIKIEFVECDYRLDEAYKPGLFVQTENFVRGEDSMLCRIDYHLKMMDDYNNMASYN